MTRYESPEELAGKVDWEGGLTEAILGYGIKSEDLPVGTPPEIVDAWKRVEAVGPDVDKIQSWLPEPGTDDEEDM